MTGLLVLGKTGQVARELARLRPDATFWGRDRADLATPGDWRAGLQASGCRAIINAAAYTAVDQAESDNAAAMAVNGRAPGIIAEVAAGLSIPLVHISTDYVFDGSGDQPRAEDAPTGPLGVYGASKHAGEVAVLDSGAQAAILRTSWVFSAHGNNFVKTMRRLGREREALRVVADQIGGPTPAAAIARACVTMVQAMSDDATLRGIYHFSGSPDVSWADFARAIMGQAGLNCRIENISTEEYPTPARRPRNSRLNCDRIRADFGIERPDWATGLADVLAELTHEQQ